MKTAALRIALRLSAYNSKDVIAGIKIWNDGVEVNLANQGWQEQNDKPKDREYFELAGKFWVQDQAIHEASIKQVTKKRVEKAKIKAEDPFWQKIQKFLAAKLGPKVIESVYQERLKACGYNVDKKCEYLKIKNDKAWCAACGCGFRKDAELSVKLKMARVECPRIPPLFKLIDEKKDKHLLIK